VTLAEVGIDKTDALHRRWPTWYLKTALEKELLKGSFIGAEIEMSNHSPHFAPEIHPTLRTGVETLVVASSAWVAADAHA
jgi:hypothetical protein